MLKYSKQQRLLSKKDFKNLFTESKRVRFDRGSVVIKRNDLETCRLGISISRKVINAVGRNRIKRLIRETFRLYRSRNKCCDYLVIVHSPILDEISFRSYLRKLFG